ncbi:hypothetical protein C8Q75DRAFT_729903 [Abortiporus biennis]|nr:hypothetical protein C8Q75DRAFT_729903 [Abortiporus biennis]
MGCGTRSKGAANEVEAMTTQPSPTQVQDDAVKELQEQLADAIARNDALTKVNSDITARLTKLEEDSKAVKSSPDDEYNCKKKKKKKIPIPKKDKKIFANAKLSREDYKDIQYFIHHFVDQSLDFTREWGQQDPEMVATYFQMCNKWFPVLKEYEGNWLSARMAIQYLQNKRKTGCNRKNRRRQTKSGHHTATTVNSDVDTTGNPGDCATEDLQRTNVNVDASESTHQSHDSIAKPLSTTIKPKPRRAKKADQVNTPDPSSSTTKNSKKTSKKSTDQSNHSNRDAEMDIDVNYDWNKQKAGDDDGNDDDILTVLSNSSSSEEEETSDSELSDEED